MSAGGGGGGRRKVIDKSDILSVKNRISLLKLDVIADLASDDEESEISGGHRPPRSAGERPSGERRGARSVAEEESGGGRKRLDVVREQRSRPFGSCERVGARRRRRLGVVFVPSSCVPHPFLLFLVRFIREYLRRARVNVQ